MLSLDRAHLRASDLQQAGPVVLTAKQQEVQDKVNASLAKRGKPAVEIFERDHERIRRGLRKLLVCKHLGPLAHLGGQANIWPWSGRVLCIIHRFRYNYTKAGVDKERMCRNQHDVGRYAAVADMLLCCACLGVYSRFSPGL